MHHARTFRCVTGLSMLVVLQADRVVADSTADGAHYRIVCHFDNEPIAKAALETAEAVWPVAVDLWGIKAGKPAAPLEIHLYRTATDYEAAEQERTGGTFKSNLSFSYHKDKSSHIALQPPCTDATFKKIGLPYLTRSQIAHEASHLFTYSTIPNFASHPAWLAEGAATWIADRTMMQGKWSRSVRGNPDTSTMLDRCRRMKTDGKLPVITKIVSGEPLGGGVHEDYSVYYQYFRFLNGEANRKALKAMLGKARQLGGGGDYTDRLRDAVIEIMGGDEGVKKLDGEFASFVESAKPAWNEVFRSLDAHPKEWTQVAFPEKNAIAWRMTPVGKKTYTLSGSVEILPNTKQQMNVLLGKDDTGFIVVAMTAGFGVTIFHHHIEDSRWENLASKETKVLQPNRRIPFSISVKGKKLRVSLDGKEVLSCDLGDKDMTGPWGVGAQAGSAGIWRGVKASS